MGVNSNFSSNTQITTQTEKIVLLKSKYRYIVLKRKSANQILKDSIHYFFKKLDERLEIIIEENGNEMWKMIEKCRYMDNSTKYMILNIVLNETIKLQEELRKDLNDDDLNLVNEFMTDVSNSKYYNEDIDNDINTNKTNDKIENKEQENLNEIKQDLIVNNLNSKDTDKDISTIKNDQI